MGWVRLLRTAGAIARRHEREARRRQRELHAEMQRGAKAAERAANVRAAQLAVEEFENSIDVLTSLHRECAEAVDWEAALTTAPPPPPQATAFATKCTARTELAQVAIATFRPTFWDRLLGRAAAKRAKLEAELAEAVADDASETERLRDAHHSRHQRVLHEHDAAVAEAAETRQLAAKVLSGDSDAWITAIRDLEAFSELAALGGRVVLRARPPVVEALLHVHDASVVPTTARSLTKTGKLSERQMPRTRFVEVYQDYVCGAVLRVARDLLAVLPAETAYVTAVGLLLDTSTGEQDVRPIVSVKVPRTTLARLNFDALDPSDSMANFVHNMKLKRGVGFVEVDFVEGSELRP